jgi:hypothetical protein
VEGVGGIELFEFIPTDRRGDRPAFAGAGGVGSDRGGAAFVPQPVDEDSPLSIGLRHGGDEIVRIAIGEVLGDRLAEALRVVSGDTPDKGHDHMDALAAGYQGERLEVNLGELVAKRDSGAPDGGEGDT